MLLAREFVAYLSRQLVRKLSPAVIETSTPDLVAESIAQVIGEELAVEDRLNDEVRDLLSQYSEYMRREGVSYQEMFRRIKNTLISQRKVIRASGRDTGDAMKLSRDKVTEMSHKIVDMLRKSRELRMKNKDTNDGAAGDRAHHDRTAAGRGQGGSRGPPEDPLPEARDRRRQRGMGPAAAALLFRGTEKARYRSRQIEAVLQ